MMAQISPLPAPQVPAWASHTTEEDELEEEPPEFKPTSPQQFKRTTIRRPADNSSLLTRAIQKQSDDEEHEVPQPILNTQRRRSMTSNISLASTADLTSDTGLTSPSRTNTPSPPVPEMLMMRLRDNAPNSAVPSPVKENAAPRKRCIQFACGGPAGDADGPPKAEVMSRSASTREQQPRRPSIRFVCTAKPGSSTRTPTRNSVRMSTSYPEPSSMSPSTPKKVTIAASPKVQSPSRPGTARRLSNKALNLRPQFLRANSKDLVKDSTQFHEFASGMSREDDWIRSENAPQRKITINDTLTKELNLRRLADEAEAEEEAERDTTRGEIQEGDDLDDEDEEDYEEEEDDEGDEDEDDEDDEDEDEDEYDSDGYNTDEETGFAESEDEDDELLSLWTPSQRTVLAQSSSIGETVRLSLDENQSDSSIAGASVIRIKPRRPRRASEALDLPDSTDFVCGTLDEDRPLEEAYMSCLAARRNEKLRVIPQDIDPSFPTSEPENDDDEEDYRPSQQQGSDDNGLPGEMEDLHHGQDRTRGRRKSEARSPRKLHSPPPPARRNRSPPPPKRMASPAPARRIRSPPPPKRLTSPAPKGRNRSPTRLFDRRSPRMRSPATRAAITPTQSPRQGAHVKFRLAGRPVTTHTKSLPRPSAILGNMRHGRCHRQHRDSDSNLRGAIDIVKGLEKKRQRRSEKFYQKYCNRARRGQLPERKPQPGRGAERMKELGLLMAGKKEQGNYVMSF